MKIRGIETWRESRPCTRSYSCPSAMLGDTGNISPYRGGAPELHHATGDVAEHAGLPSNHQLQTSQLQRNMSRHYCFSYNRQITFLWTYVGMDVVLLLVCVCRSQVFPALLRIICVPLYSQITLHSTECALGIHSRMQSDWNVRGELNYDQRKGQECMDVDLKAIVQASAVCFGAESTGTAP